MKKSETAKKKLSDKIKSMNTVQIKDVLIDLKNKLTDEADTITIYCLNELGDRIGKTEFVEFCGVL